MERKLSIYQYFEILQKEWLVVDLRCRIYSSKKDKAFWLKVREGKRVKIENIAEKNKLPTIFTDSELKKDLERTIYNDYTYPNFHYKDENHMKDQGYWDLANYYSKDSEVRFESNGEMKVGRVVEYVPFSKIIRVRCVKTEETEQVSVSKVLRIL